MNDRIQQAIAKAPRENFLPESVAEYGKEDMPVPIGYGVTNSQPSTVYQMLEWLDVQPGHHVLDVGSGSGWTTAIIANLVGENGHVTAVELIPELVTMGEQNCKNLGIKNVEFHEANDVIGWSDNAPYDRILVSAAVEDVPSEFIEQLKLPGVLVIPVNEEMQVINKDKDGNLEAAIYYGFSFVPFKTSK